MEARVLLTGLGARRSGEVSHAILRLCILPGPGSFLVPKDRAGKMLPMGVGGGLQGLVSQDDTIANKKRWIR